MAAELTPEQRESAIQSAADLHAARTAMLAALGSGDLSLAAALKLGRTDDTIRRVKVSAVLLSLPGTNPGRVDEVMADLGLADYARLGGLTDEEHRVLLDTLG